MRSLGICGFDYGGNSVCLYHNFGDLAMIQRVNGHVIDLTAEFDGEDCWDLNLKLIGLNKLKQK